MFNRNIDYDWTGGILLDYKKIVDKCTRFNGVQPVLYIKIPGIAFDKVTPYDYLAIVTHLMNQ